MFSSLRKPVLNLSLLSALLAPNVQADESPYQWYVAAKGGLGLLANTDLDSQTLGDGDARFDAGFGAGASLGVERGPWAAELDLVYRTNGLDRVRGTTFTGSDDGDYSSLGLGVSVLRYVDLLPNPKVKTYIGGGLVWFQEIDIDFETNAGERSFSGDDIAWQVRAGVRYELSERWHLHAEVAHLSASSLKLEGEGVAAGQFKADYERTSAVFGVSYRF